MPNLTGWANRPLYQPRVGTGQQGGGVLGALRRFGRGFVREVVANTPGEFISGPVSLPRGIIGGIRNAWQGRDRGPNNRAESPMFSGGFEGAGPPMVDPSSVNMIELPDFSEGPRDPQASRGGDYIYGSGEGVMRDPRGPSGGQRSGVGVRGGQVIARGADAQRMFEAMRGNSLDPGSFQYQDPSANNPRWKEN